VIRTIRTLTAATLALAALASFPARADDTRAQGAEAAVLATQDQRFAATVAADVPALSRLFTDDMTYTHSSAVVDTKAQFLEGLRAGKYQYRSITPEERAVRLYGDAAVVVGIVHVTVVTGGKENDLRLRFTEIYVKRGGAWKLALWQSTRIPAPTP